MHIDALRCYPGPTSISIKKNLISLEHVARKISVETKERKHWFSVMYRKCQCLPKWQVNHETISPQQTMARGQRDSFRSWTELQISIYFWCREVFQEVCVCVCFGRCMCARVGGLVGRSGGLGEGRGELEDCWGVVTWVAPIQLGVRERQAEETRLRGEGTGAQLHFPFCRISTVASFFSVSLHSTEWVKERERDIEREWKRKSSQFF